MPFIEVRKRRRERGEGERERESELMKVAKNKDALYNWKTLNQIRGSHITQHLQIVKYEGSVISIFRNS